MFTEQSHFEVPIWKNENRCPHSDLYMNVRESLIHSKCRLEITNASINDGILLNHKWNIIHAKPWREILEVPERERLKGARYIPLFTLCQLKLPEYSKISA